MAGIYIHIPFCRKLCAYCNFYHVISSGDHTDFIKALLLEAKRREDYLGNESVSTIYIGGGTPSIFSVKDLERILNCLKTHFNVEHDSEITVELNPDDITGKYPEALKKAGFNRISLGIQSWRDEDLRLLNRRHTSAKAEKSLQEILNSGFENVSVDLIYGIPGMGIKDWENNINKTLDFEIKHLSAYHLTIEPETVLGKMKEKGIIKEIDEELSIAEFNMLIKKTESAGFTQYEISNFCKEDYYSIHNSNYWNQVPYLGLGPSAHSFNGYSRQWNVSDVTKYIKQVNEGELFYEKEELDIRTRYNEYIMTSLRTMWGIDLEYVEKMFEKEGYDYIVNMSDKFIDYGMIKREKKNLVLTNQGKMISDNIISELMMPEKS